MSTTTKPIEIFRAGRHTAMSGESIAFSEADLRAAAEAYDPALHEAPLVVGHPRHDAPAYGWVRALAYREGALEATPEQVDPDFAELVRKGRYKRVSASFYRPGSANNPAGDVYYLRHVGFLGAQPPAVKGLKAVELAAGEEDVVTVELAEADGGVVREVFRRLREWLIGTSGQETADQVVPAWMVDEVEREPADAASSYSEPADGPASTQQTDPPREDDVSQSEQTNDIEARRAELERREQELKAREAQFAEQAAAQRRQQYTARVDELVEQGRVLPRDREALVALFAELDEGELAFAEDGKEKKTAATEWLADFLGRLPEQVDYAERAAAESQSAAAGAELETPPGYQVRPERAELHRRALAYAEQNDVDYLTAVRAVERS